MAEIEKVLDGLYRLKSNLRIMCVGINNDYYDNSVKTVDNAIQTVRELSDKNDELEEENSRLGDTVDELNKHLTDAFEKIRELQSQIPKWHYVVDNDFPTNDDNRFYYCVCKNKNDDKFLYIQFQYTLDYGFGYWLDDYSEFITISQECLDKVIAWMELPKFEDK